MLARGDTILFDARIAFTKQCSEREAEKVVLEQKHRALGNMRLGGLGVAVAICFAAIGEWGLSGWWVLVPLGIIFWLGVQLDRVELKLRRLERAILFYERGLSRLDGKWIGKGESGIRFADPTHLYSLDLDLFGDGSLFQRICTARTEHGMARLAAWLKNPSEPNVVVSRQESVDELAPKLTFREDLSVLGGDFAQAAVDTDALATWGDSRPVFCWSPSIRMAWVGSICGGITLLSGLVYILAGESNLNLADATRSAFGWTFVVAVGIVAVVRLRVKATVEQVFLHAERAGHDAATLTDLLARLEQEPFSTSRLIQLSEGLEVDGELPSSQLQRIVRLMEQVDSRHNLFARLFNFVFVWDVYLARAVDRWRESSGSALGRWIDILGEVEALSSFAAYRLERPNDIWPEFASDTQLEADSIGHPLLHDSAVNNDVQLSEKPQVLIVSGSNMSGKSTLLRTIGLNVVLAQAGAPVNARRFQLSPLTVGASIRISDSLQEGSSRFLSEIRRLRAILEKTSGPAPVLFLIDECLHGTNSHERQVGARTLVESLVAQGAIGLITTHDLALTEIVDGLGERAQNVYLRDELRDGHLYFDYKLRRGVLEKGNAIDLMRLIGFDIR